MEERSAGAVKLRHYWHLWPPNLPWLLLGGIVGSIIGRLFPPFTLDDGFWRAFIASAGFGGVMAVVAAVVAYLAARHSARSARAQAEADRDQRKVSDRKEQWWARAEWALNQVVSGNEEIGYRMLNALAESEWAEEHEADVIAAATDDALSAEEVVSEGNQEPELSTGEPIDEKIDREGGTSLD